MLSCLSKKHFLTLKEKEINYNDVVLSVWNQNKTMAKTEKEQSRMN